MAQTMSTYETATNTVNARFACAEIRAAAANSPIASTKPVGANAAAAVVFNAACDSPVPVIHRNAALVRCPVEVAVGGLDQPGVRVGAVRVVEAVQRGQRAACGDFEDRGVSVGPAGLRGPGDV